ncbi:MAG TPA: HD domain-containing phosphohydrolase [Solirubrobacteraceae bacterium]|nr:HD domain-containing phosphohydrolase [Solirubrobacteraceae bacterium]
MLSKRSLPFRSASLPAVALGALDCALLAGALTTAALFWRSSDWQPLPLLLLIVALAVVGDRLTIEIRNQSLTAGFVAHVLSMVLLGPAPAVLVGLLISADYLVRYRLPPSRWLPNVATPAALGALGGVVARTVIDHNEQAMARSIWFGLLVFGIFFLTNGLNFLSVALDKRVRSGKRFLPLVRDMFVPLLPSQVAAALLAAILAVAYENLGYPVLLGLVLVLIIFQYLAIALLRSEDRADQLEARSMHLASLQIGVLTTLVETLALRDRVTARHSAAVARYAQALAREAGCSQEEQEVAHTAGLLHDIGKFALPDRVLNAEVLSDEDWALIRRHPQDGATLVGRLDGYGPIADAILYHHERVDGSGYPAGLIGQEIPLISRILAICSAYDTMTSRDSYRPTKTPQDAIAELRRMAGRQFDADLVASFVAMREREGLVAVPQGDEADFEDELAFERRVRAFAQPAGENG